MKKLIIPILMFSVCYLGFSVYKNAELKKQQEADQVFNEYDDQTFNRTEQAKVAYSETMSKQGINNSL
ncbi:hypothetical protein [Acinetobacter gandensis]|uniref:hypothetical protein n=1 Tax=Acinetobacter gandensis TaxID=1443941 RepID=UPI00398A2F4C